MSSHEQPPLFEMASELPPVYDPTASAAEALARYERQKVLTDEADAEPQPQTMGQAERLRVMHDLAGFYPTNNNELTRAFAIEATKDTPAGVAGYLNEILQHQKKTPRAEDPAAALRSVVAEMAGYAQKARADKTALDMLRQELRASADTNTLSSLKQIGVATGLGQYVRHLDLRRVAEMGDNSQLPFNPLKGSGTAKRTAFDPYTASRPAPEIRQRIDQVMASTRLWQAKVIIAELVDEQSQRFDFWTDNINDSRRHGAARGVAYSALKSLGITPTGHA